MTGIGDTEPEDAWDAGDSTERLVRLLFRMVALLDLGPEYAVRRIDPLDEVEHRLLAFLRGRVLTERQHTRAIHIAYGLGFLRGRAGNG